MAGEFQNCIPVTEYERKKAINTIGRRGVTIADIENWKNKHWNRIDKIIKANGNSEYESIKVIVKEILYGRESINTGKQVIMIIVSGKLF